jgi:succinate-acetate transporter protein
MALGNTFGATALASYGGFWISIGIILTPGGFDIASTYGGDTADFYTAFGLYLYVSLLSCLRISLSSCRKTDLIVTGLVHL